MSKYSAGEEERQENWSIGLPEFQAVTAWSAYNSSIEKKVWSK